MLIYILFQYGTSADTISIEAFKTFADAKTKLYHKIEEFRAKGYNPHESYLVKLDIDFWASLLSSKSNDDEIRICIEEVNIKTRDISELYAVFDYYEDIGLCNREVFVSLVDAEKYYAEEIDFDSVPEVIVDAQTPDHSQGIISEAILRTSDLGDTYVWLKKLSLN